MNPLKWLTYPRPFHSVTFINPTVTFANTDAVTVSQGVVLNYSAVNTVTASPIAIRARLPREPLNNSYGGSQRNTYSVNDIERVELCLKPAHLRKDTILNYVTIQGTSRPTIIDYGGRENGDNGFPTNLETTEPTWSRTGINPSCYRKGAVGHPWDNFFFAEFIPKIRASDTYNNSTTLVARHNDEARYKDGKYHLFAKIQSVGGVYNTYNNPSDSTTTSITIDNFAPFVHSLQIWESSQLHPDSTKYKATGTLLAAANGFDGTFKWLNPIANQTIDPDNDVVVNVFTSEAMDSTSMRLKVQRLSDGQFLNLGPNNQASPTWMLNTGTNAYRSFTFRIPSALLTANLNTFPTTSNNATFRLVLNGRDQNGNNLIEKRTAMTAGNAGTMTLRVRTGNAPTAWSSSYSPTVTTGDSYHEFNTFCVADGQLKSSPSSSVCTNLEPNFTFVTNGLNVTFTNQTTGPTISNAVYWNFGNGMQLSVGPTVTYIFPSPGVYPVTLQVTQTINGVGLTGEVQKMVTVTACTGFSPQYYIGANNGTVNQGYISLLSGNEYRYRWSNGATTPNIANLANGDYSLTLTEVATGCVQVNSYRVSPTCTNPLYVNANVYSAMGTGCGIIATSLSTFGGSGTLPAVTYRWSNGAATPNISGLAPGSYTLTVTRADGCGTLRRTYTVLRADFNLAVTPGCGRGSVGLTVSNLGATSGAQFSYRWQSSVAGSTVYTTTRLDNVPTGTYGLTVTRVLGASTCTFTSGAFSVIGYNYASPTITFVPNRGYLADFGLEWDFLNAELTAEVQSSVAGGDYTYQWSNGMTTPTITAQNGVYALTVSDRASGCNTTASYVLCPFDANNPTLEVNYYNRFNPDFSGSIGIGYLPGHHNFSYNWITSSGTATTSSLPLPDRATGVYSVTVTDGASGCKAVRSHTVLPQSYNSTPVMERYGCTGGTPAIWRAIKYNPSSTNPWRRVYVWYEIDPGNPNNPNPRTVVDSLANIPFTNFGVQVHYLFRSPGYQIHEIGTSAMTTNNFATPVVSTLNCVEYTYCQGREVSRRYAGSDERLDATCQNMVGYCGTQQVSSRRADYWDIVNRGIQIIPSVVDDSLGGRCDAYFMCNGRRVVYDSSGVYVFNQVNMIDSIPRFLDCFRNFRYCDFVNPYGDQSLRHHGQPDRVEGGIGPVLTVPYSTQIGQRVDLCSVNEDYYEYTCFGRRLFACVGITGVTSGGWVPTKNALPLQTQSIFDISIFPNPSDADFYFRITSPTSKKEHYRFELYNVLGSVVQRAELDQIEPDNEYKLPFESEIPQGTYLLKISSSNGEFQTFKIQKQ